MARPLVRLVSKVSIVQARGRGRVHRLTMQLLAAERIVPLVRHPSQHRRAQSFIPVQRRMRHPLRRDGHQVSEVQKQRLALLCEVHNDIVLQREPHRELALVPSEPASVAPVDVGFGAIDRVLEPPQPVVHHLHILPHARRRG
jgi:hypothetical protein